ncbi:MAG: hypothetical protein JWO56_2358 [Acidobacteria bacterium]|nr:hypothetical protein [Acidobacteriota bacterium]
MGDSQSTSVLIRVQARSGKFVGQNVNYSQISILNGDQVLFGPYTTSGDTGTVDSTPDAPFLPTASRDVIAVQASAGGPPAGAYWLTADSSGTGGGTAGVIATFPLADAALLEFRATALFDTANPVTTSTMMWVYPGMQLTSEPGLLLSIPGLVVTLPQPTIAGGQITITATVTMMCGCPITKPTWPQGNAPEPYWPETEFQVMAFLTPSSGPIVSHQMDFIDTNTFATSFPLPSAGALAIAVYALQQAESNGGYAQTPVNVSTTS